MSRCSVGWVCFGGLRRPVCVGSRVTMTSPPPPPPQALARVAHAPLRLEAAHPRTRMVDGRGQWRVHAVVPRQAARGRHVPQPPPRRGDCTARERWVVRVQTPLLEQLTHIHVNAGVVMLDSPPERRFYNWSEGTRWRHPLPGSLGPSAGPAMTRTGPQRASPRSTAESSSREPPAPTRAFAVRLQTAAGRPTAR
jgi:hypothetical protein